MDKEKLTHSLIPVFPLPFQRYCSSPPGETYYGERHSSTEATESTTLHIVSPKHRSQSPRELFISESQNKAYYNTEFPKAPELLCTQLHASSSGEERGHQPAFQGNDNEVPRCFSPGDMVELQVSFSEQTLDGMGCTSLGSAHGVEGEYSNREAIKKLHTATASHYVPCSVREPLSQHGVVLSSPSMLRQVEVILQQPEASRPGRGILSVGGPWVSGSVGSQSEGEEGGGHCEGAPGTFSVSFGIPSEEETPAEEQGSESEGDQDKPNKHRAKHASEYHVDHFHFYHGVLFWYAFFVCSCVYMRVWIIIYSLRWTLLANRSKLKCICQHVCIPKLMSSVCTPQNSMCCSLQLEEGTHSFEGKQIYPGLT